LQSKIDRQKYEKVYFRQHVQTSNIMALHMIFLFVVKKHTTE